MKVIILKEISKHTSDNVKNKGENSRFQTNNKYDMAFVEDFDHLSLQMGNMEHKQEQKLAVEALLSGKCVMAVLPTGFGKTIIC